MKRFSLIFLGALAILMAGCSKNNPQQPDPDAWVHDLSLPVPIQFGSSLVETKGGFESADDLEGLEGFGVYGLAKNDDASWVQGTQDVLLYNTKAGVESGSVVLTGGPYYYPRESTRNFSFYGYFPRLVGTTLKDGVGLGAPVGVGSAENARYALGKTDFIWAKAAAKGNGYNAKYIRGIRSESIDDESPIFNFRHVTSGLKFVAVANMDENVNTGAASNTDADFVAIKIKSVTLKNVFTSGWLCVAGENEGEIIELGDPASLTITPDSDVNPTALGTEIGEFFPYPDPNSDSGYEVEVKVESPLGTYTVDFTTEKLVPGTRYVYNLLFHKVDDVRIKIGELSWDNVVETPVDTDDLTGADNSDDSDDPNLP